LEEATNQNILAVVQVARSPGASSASPFAVRAAIQRCHDLFCILRCGGIQHRLSSKDHVPTKGSSKFISISSMAVLDVDDDEPPPELSFAADIEQQEEWAASPPPTQIRQKKSFDVDEDDLVFPGMKQLYARRKEARTLRNKLAKTSELLIVKRESLQKELVVLEELILQLLIAMPIHKLRQHLMEHYNAFLVDVGTASFAGVAFRCLIDSVPEPIPCHGESPSEQHKSSIPGTFGLTHVGRSIKLLIDSAAKNYVQDSPLLLGASSFFKGKFLFTHTVTSIPGIGGSTVQHALKLNLSNRISTLLMGYMISFRQKIEHAVQNSSRNVQSMMQDQQPAFLAGTFSKIYISPTTKDEASVQDIDCDQHSCSLGQFLTSPPLSMLNVSDEVREVYVPSFGKVWTPVVHIPIDHQDENDFLQANVVLFDVGQYSFLLYFDPGATMEASDLSSNTLEDLLPNEVEELEVGFSPTVGPISPYAALLEELADSLTTCVMEIGTEGDVTGSIFSFGEVPGQHTVFVDRSMEKLVLFSNRGIPNDGEEKGAGGGKSSRKNLATKKPTQNDALLRNGIEAAIPGLDCRHFLATRLAEDVVLAFDDMMSSVSESKNDPLRAPDDCSHGKEFELCTYLAQGWMWACARGDKELYIFFDSKKFSTIADVETSANCMRNALFNESLIC
jgi:hypothetical protein